MGDRDRRRRRLSREESRRALLDAGKAAVYEQPVSPGLDHIRINDVAARVGLTSGAFYHHWEFQEDYRDELLDELFAADRWPVVHDLIASLHELIESGARPEELVRVASEASWRGAADDPQRLRTQMGFWARGEGVFGERLRQQYHELTKYWSDLFAGVMAPYGLTPRAPYTNDLVAITLMALLEGLFVRSDADPDLATPAAPLGSKWTLFGLGAVVFLAGATAPEGDDRDVLSDIAARWPRRPEVRDPLA